MPSFRRVLPRVTARSSRSERRRPLDWGQSALVAVGKKAFDRPPRACGMCGGTGEKLLQEVPRLVVMGEMVGKDADGSSAPERHGEAADEVRHEESVVTPAASSVPVHQVDMGIDLPEGTVSFGAVDRQRTISEFSQCGDQGGIDAIPRWNENRSQAPGV